MSAQTKFGSRSFALGALYVDRQPEVDHAALVGVRNSRRFKVDLVSEMCAPIRGIWPARAQEHRLGNSEPRDLCAALLYGEFKSEQVVDFVGNRIYRTCLSKGR